MAQPGAPALPYVITSIAMPAQGEAVAEITAADCTLVPGQWRLQPAPKWSLAASEPDARQQWLEDGAPWQQTYDEDPAIYGSAASFPPALVELSSPQTMRGRRVVQVRVYPWQTTPLSGQVRFCRTIEMRVAFSQPAATQTPAAPADPEFDALLADQVLNWPVARAWPTAAASASAAPPARLPWQTGVRITVGAAGLYHVTYADLAGLNVPVGNLDPATLRVFYRDQELSIEIVGGDDGAFNPGDEIRFYAAPQRSRYGTTSVYWLVWGRARPAHGCPRCRAVRFHARDHYLYANPAS